MRFGKFSALIVSLVTLVAAGCGGGGGGSNVVFPAGRTVSGTASKGPIVGGTVKVFQVVSSATTNPRTNIPRLATTPLNTGTTAADGSYSLSIPANVTSGSLLVQITGGTYTDEATGNPKNVVDQYGANGMRAYISKISASGTLSVSVTPYTELAVEHAGANLTDDNLASSNSKVAAAFNLPDIVATKPADASKAFAAGTSDDAKKYALGLATLSQYQKDFNGATLATISAAFAAQIAGAGLDPVIAGQLGASGNNFASGPRNPNAELRGSLDNASAPAVITTTPATPTSISIGSTVPISAQVLKSGGANVPDGTLITFSTTFGTLSATTAATVNGVASVNLSSNAVGIAVVTASYGSLTGTAAGINFADPNAPASLILTANANQGVTTGPAVVLSAAVTRAAGGPVPNGTPVSFQIVSGSGTLSGATTTNNGVATVNLSSSVGGASVSVKATAGSVSQTVSVPFIVQPTQAVVKVRTTGTLTGALIGGVNATVTYSTNKGLSIAPAGVAVSGGGTGSILVPNTNTNGAVVLGLLSVGGIPLGEFATLTFGIAAGNFPTSADFGVAIGSSAIDVTTATIPGVSAEILSVVVQ